MDYFCAITNLIHEILVFDIWIEQIVYKPSKSWPKSIPLSDSLRSKTAIQPTYAHNAQIYFGQFRTSKVIFGEVKMGKSFVGNIIWKLDEFGYITLKFEILQ